MDAKYPLMPFLFNVLDTEYAYAYSVVKIAKWDMVVADVAWMDDHELPQDRTLVPDVDICHESHRFDTEEEALAFIRKWWCAQGGKS